MSVKSEIDAIMERECFAHEHGGKCTDCEMIIDGKFECKASLIWGILIGVNEQ